MHIIIVSVGKLKEDYLRQGLGEYLKRLSAYAEVEIIEVPDGKAPETLGPAEVEEVKNKEGTRLLPKIPSDSYVIALAIEGEQMDSMAFANRLDELVTYGKSRVTFIIGGSYGLSKEILRRADQQLSFSKMTFPHQLFRLMLIEQIYRAFKIHRGEPYHK